MICIGEDILQIKNYVRLLVGGGVGNDHKLLGQKTDIFQGLKNSTSWRLERGKNIIRTVPSFLFLQINYNL